MPPMHRLVITATVKIISGMAGPHSISTKKLSNSAYSNTCQRVNLIKSAAISFPLKVSIVTPAGAKVLKTHLLNAQSNGLLRKFFKHTNLLNQVKL